MLKNISVKLHKGIGIKKFGIVIRDGEKNKLNIRQIYKLFCTRAVREIWEHNEKGDKKIRLHITNYKDTIDWDKVSASETSTPSPGNKENSSPKPAESNTVNKVSSQSLDNDEVPVPDGVTTEEFEGNAYEKVSDDYDPESGIDPDKEDTK